MFLLEFIVKVEGFPNTVALCYSLQANLLRRHRLGLRAGLLHLFLCGRVFPDRQELLSGGVEVVRSFI